jgi:transcriptional regulator with XRE-family HTH domain
MASAPSVLQAIDEARSKWENVAPSLRALKRYLGATDTQLGDALGLAHQQISKRLKGGTALSYWEVAGLATLFEVPEDVLFKGPDAAIRWVLDHPSETRDFKRGQSACYPRDLAAA